MDNEWIESIKKIVLQAVEAGKPCNILSGTVEKLSPMSIRVDQKTMLEKRQLLVPQGLTDYTVQMVIPELGEVPVEVKNSLKAGEQVILVQKPGAQEYLVVDRY